MKKNREMYRGLFLAPRSKLFLVMKLTFLFLLIGLLEVHASVRAQERMINLDVKEMTLRDVFDELKKQTDMDFFFSNRELDMNKRVTIRMRDVGLTDVLAGILGRDYSFEIFSGMVIIKPVMQKDSVRVKEVVIKGIVKDKNKSPMPGVTVKLGNTGIGTATNVKGFFQLTLPIMKGVLEFSFVGYKTQKLPFSGSSKDSLQVIMEENVQALDEAVVVAYGTTNKREMTGAVSVVKAEELKGIPATDIATLLQGRVAGMDVTNMSGAPGGGGTAITIRGYNSLDVEQGRRFSNPLWVVDGVPLNSFASPVTGTNLLADINPDMIESIQILKDASSASIYGSRAANGVIIVTTKKGRNNQKATFSANVSQTWSIVPEFPTVMIGKGERDFRWKTLAGYQAAYLDKETKRYKYPLSNEEVFWNGGRQDAVYDYFFSRDANFSSDVIPTLQDSLNSFYNNATNFFPVYFRKGKVTNANLQAYGGGEQMSYGIGLGYYNETGVFVGTGFDRIDLNSNLNVTPVKRLNVDLRFNASLMNRKRGEKVEDFGSAPMVEKVPGDPFWLSTLYPGEGSESWDATLNKLRGTKEENRSVRLRSNFKIGYAIVEGLDVSTSLAVDYSIHRRNYFQPSYLSAKGYSQSLGETGINLMVLNENLVSYQKILKEDHSINVLAGFSYQYDQMEYNGGYAQNSPSDKIYYAPSGMPTLGQEVTDYSITPVAFQRYLSDMQEKSLISYFGRLEYNYKKKYLFSLSFRWDGSSVFGRHKRWGTFPSVAGGWSFSEENFIKDNLGWLSFGKFRASWGRSGKHFEEPYLALGLLDIGESSHLGNATLEPIWKDGCYNEDLSWEETDQYDFGLDLDLFDYRLGITVDYYYRYTDKLLYPVKLAGDYNGFYTQWRNAAAISNEGIELLVKYEIFRNSDFYWKVSVNAAKNWNRIEKSYNKKDLNFGVTGKPLNRILGLKTTGYVNKQEELPLVYKTSGQSNYLAPGNGLYLHQEESFYRPGDYRIVDVDGDGWIGKNDQVYLGSALPIVNGGLVSEFRWKNFDLNLSMHFSIGRHMVNNMWMNSLTFNMDPQSSYYAHPILMDIRKHSFWEKVGDNDAEYPRLQPEGKYIYQENIVIDRQIEKVNYLKLKTLTFGYSLPHVILQRLGLNDIRVFVSGENLFTWTNYSGIDPEVVDIRTGIDDGISYPLARKYTLGLTVKF